jgi:hypothetical protein
VLTLTHGVVAIWAAAICAVAHSAGVRAVSTGAGGAFVVVHSLVGAMLAVNVAIVQVVDVIGVQHRFVSAPWAVGVTVVFSLGVLDCGHNDPLSGGL